MAALQLAKHVVQRYLAFAQKHEQVEQHVAGFVAQLVVIIVLRANDSGITSWKPSIILFSICISCNGNLKKHWVVSCRNICVLINQSVVFFRDQFPILLKYILTLY